MPGPMQMKRDAFTFARAALDAQGLHDWKVGFNSRKRAAGLCDYRTKTISISIYHLHDEWSSVRNTILHEIAHAKAGHAAGHGPAWKRIAISLGCTGDRCYEMGEAMTAATFRWKGMCAVHGLVSLKHKAPRGASSCSFCTHGAGYNAAYPVHFSANTERYGVDDMYKPSHVEKQMVKRNMRRVRRQRRASRFPFIGF